MEKIVNPVIGEEVIFHTTSRQSNGEKTLMEITLSPKGGNPLHYHKRFAEKFTVIDGELNVQIGKSIHKLKKGDTATANIKDRHRFFNTSGKTTKFYCELTPASEGFENVLRIGFGLSRDGYAAKNGLPKSIRHMSIIMNMGEGYFVGIFSIFEKIFRLVAKSGKSKKIEKELLEKYCSQTF
ncbi:MAG: cupin domain-containing protein [Lewinellaceae bacterium]|nr:cupin domain-containing protein [Lewinellaceae bacterium]